MLDGEKIAQLDELEPDRLHLGGELPDRHLVERLDGNVRVLAAVFEKNNAALFRESPHDRLHHLAGMGKLVVGVDHQHEIDLARGQLRVVDGPEQRLDVRDLLQLLAALDELQHLRLDVHGDHFSLWNQRGHQKREITRTGPNVGDGVVGGKIQVFNHQGRLFLRFAIPSFQPGDGVRTHRLGDFTTHVDLPGPVPRGLLAGVDRVIGMKQHAAAKHEVESPSREARTFSRHVPMMRGPAEPCNPGNPPDHVREPALPCLKFRIARQLRHA